MIHGLTYFSNSIFSIDQDRLVNQNQYNNQKQKQTTTTISPSNPKIPSIPHLLFLHLLPPVHNKWNLSPPTTTTTTTFANLHPPSSSTPPPPNLHPPFTDMSPDPKPLSTTTHHIKPKTIPDFFVTTAFSLLCLFTSSNNNKSPLLKLNFPFYPRRSFKIPIMSLPKKTFAATPQSLSDWLRPRLPSDSFASWGVKPGTKNVHNLWLELAEGETSLADSTPPVRSVNVVSVRILNQDRVLVESRQELSDGNVRDRCRPLSEKMKPDETPEEAVFRAVKEELGSVVSGDGVRILPGSYRRKVEERDSKSYPGLPARYVLHSVDATVEGLPEGEFCTEEAEEYGGEVTKEAVCVIRHHWKWVSVDSITS